MDYLEIEMAKIAADLVIRNMTVHDYEAVVSLWQLAGLPYRPEGRDQLHNVARELSQDTAIFLIGELKNDIVSAVFGTHDGRKGWINRLVVHPDFQCKGIGYSLVQAVEQRLSDHGIDIVACLIEDWNPQSMAFFKKIGYCPHDDIVYFSHRKHPQV